MAIETEDSLILVGTSGDWRADWEEERRILHEMHDRMLELDDDEVVGAVLSWPVADGLAWYHVVNDDPLTLQHIETGDSWEANYLIIKGLDRDDVLHEIAMAKRRNERGFGGWR